MQKKYIGHEYYQLLLILILHYQIQFCEEIVP